MPHIVFDENDNKKTVGKADEHCAREAELVDFFGKEIGSETIINIFGFLHDSCKRCDDFDGYIRKENNKRR